MAYSSHMWQHSAHAVPAGLADHALADSRGLPGAQGNRRPFAAANAAPSDQADCYTPDVVYQRDKLADTDPGIDGNTPHGHDAQYSTPMVTGCSAHQENRRLQQELDLLQRRAREMGLLPDCLQAAQGMHPSPMAKLTQTVQQPQQQYQKQGAQQTQRQRQPGHETEREEVEWACRLAEVHESHLQQLQQQRQSMQHHSQQQILAARSQQLKERKAELIRELAQLTSGVAAAARVSSAVADRDSMPCAQLQAQLSNLHPLTSPVVQAEHLSALASSSMGKLRSAAHAAASAPLEQEAALGGPGVPHLSAGGHGTAAEAGQGPSPDNSSSTEASEQQMLDAIDRLGSGYWVGCRRAGAYGRKDMPNPASPFTPQFYALFNQGGLTTATSLLNASRIHRGQLQHTQLTADPRKLAKLMRTYQRFAAAQRACLLDMAEAGYITMDTIPAWEVFWCTWDRLAEEFQQRGSWGEFLAANQKAWLLMYEHGLPPDWDCGRIDLLQLLPYMSWLPFGGAAGVHSSGSGRGGAKGGSSSSNGVKPCRQFHNGKCTHGAACRFKH